MPKLSAFASLTARAWGFTSGLVKDQYFNLVSLLLPGNGTNATNNRDFRDSSSNNFSITPNGNTTQGSFSPFSQTGWGGNFNGTSFIQAPDNATMQVGTSDFTIEFWAYFTSDFSGAKWIGGKGDQATATGTAFSLYSTAFEVYSGSTVYSLTTPTWSSNRWYHIAIVRSGTGANNLKLYIDGSVQSQASISTNSVNSASGNGFKIGAYSSTGVASYISNFRFVKGRAVYTSAFTPPTTPLGVTSGGQNPPQGTETSLLVLQSNRFIDVANNYTITTSGSPSVVAFSPFAPTAAYTTSVVGGSGYFDGNGDYLTVPDNAAFDLPGDFTIEMWVYASTTPGGTKSFINHADAASTGWAFGFNGTGTNLFWYTNSSFILNTSSGLVLNAWNHVAAVRSGTSLVIYINGTSAGSTTNSTSYAGTGLLYVGSDQYNQAFTGTLSNVRVVKGQALASGNFTPPTAPVTTSAVGWTGANAAGSLTGTVSLLLNFTNGAIFDATAKNDLETVGNAQISTSVSKFGGGSISLASASNSYLQGNTPSNWTFLHDGSTWTIEFWIYPTNVSSFQGVFATNAAGSANIGLGIAINAGTITLSFTRGVSGSAATFTSSAVLNANDWNYVGITFTNSTKTCAFFINGASAGSSSNTGFAYSSSTSTYPPYIGQTGDSGFPYYFNGYIDDFRITRGVARTITANPTAPFPVQ